jgi:4-hydroxyacetophenone monooxygenase
MLDQSNQRFDHSDPPTLHDALSEANVPTLLLVLAQLTGDERWLEAPFRPTRATGLDDHDTGGLDGSLQATIREAALTAISDWRAGRLASGPPPSPNRVAEMLAASLAEPVPAEYGALLAEEAGFLSREVEMPPPPPADAFKVLVVGAGLAGLCVAIQLQRAGIAYTVLEKNDDVGGTWLENTYPGCGVDTPSHLYSFSFAPRADWSRYFAPADEVRRYLHELADEHDLHASIEFGTEVIEATWQDDEARWQVRACDSTGSEKQLSANVLINATGHFNRPSIPDIDGLDAFAGPCMHTARWHDAVDVVGKRVAVVGSGASAMQVVPALAGTAARVLVFQRSPQWAVPHPNCGRALSPATRRLHQEVPLYGSWYRLRQLWRFGDRLHSALQADPDWPDRDFSVNAINDKHRRSLTQYIESELVGHPDLIAASIPDYPVYGKRPLIDHGWYRTIRREDVELISASVVAARDDVLITDTGNEYAVDVIVLATGFKTLDLLGPIKILGRSGATLRDTWGADDARAYLGISVPDFPNFFVLFGPNTNAGHGGSAFLHTEFQVRHVMQMIATMIEQGIASVECRKDVHDNYVRELDLALARTVWAHPAVTNYYRNRDGRLVGLSPWRYVDYRQRLLHAGLDDYIVDRTPRGAG